MMSFIFVQFFLTFDMKQVFYLSFFLSRLNLFHTTFNKTMSSTSIPPLFSLCAPSLSGPSSTICKNNNNDIDIDEDDEASSMPLILLILGFCIPCLWMINWAMYRNHLNSNARLFAKISGILQLIAIIVVVVLLILFFTATGIFAKKIIDGHTDMAESQHRS